MAADVSAQYRFDAWTTDNGLPQNGVRQITQTLIPTVNAELAKTGKTKIIWNEAYGGTLAKIGGELEAVEQGICDMSNVGTVFHAAKMPLQQVSFVTPFGPTDPRVVTLLLDRGANIDAPSPNRSTALMMAARYGPEDAAELLLQRGANAKLRNDLQLSAADFARAAGREQLALRLEAAAR